MLFNRAPVSTPAVITGMGAENDALGSAALLVPKAQTDWTHTLVCSTVMLDALAGTANTKKNAAARQRAIGRMATSDDDLFPPLYA